MPLLRIDPADYLTLDTVGFAEHEAAATRHATRPIALCEVASTIDSATTTGAAGGATTASHIVRRRNFFNSDAHVPVPDVPSKGPLVPKRGLYADVSYSGFERARRECQTAVNDIAAAVQRQRERTGRGGAKYLDGSFFLLDPSSIFGPTHREQVDSAAQDVLDADELSRLDAVRKHAAAATTEAAAHSNRQILMMLKSGRGGVAGARQKRKLEQEQRRSLFEEQQDAMSAGNAAATARESNVIVNEMLKKSARSAAQVKIKMPENVVRISEMYPSSPVFLKTNMKEQQQHQQQQEQHQPSLLQSSSGLHMSGSIENMLHPRFVLESEQHLKKLYQQQQYQLNNSIAVATLRSQAVWACGNGLCDSHVSSAVHALLLSSTLSYPGCRHEELPRDASGGTTSFLRSSTAGSSTWKYSLYELSENSKNNASIPRDGSSSGSHQDEGEDGVDNNDSDVNRTFPLAQHFVTPQRRSYHRHGRMKNNISNPLNHSSCSGGGTRWKEEASDDDPDFLLDIEEEDEDDGASWEFGVVGVVLYANQQWTWVIVDDTIATDRNTTMPWFLRPQPTPPVHSVGVDSTFSSFADYFERLVSHRFEQAAFVRSFRRDPIESFPLLLEKAIAKLLGNFSMLASGTASDILQMLTGPFAGTLPLNSSDHHQQQQPCRVSCQFVNSALKNDATWARRFMPKAGIVPHCLGGADKKFLTEAQRQEKIKNDRERLRRMTGGGGSTSTSTSSAALGGGGVPPSSASTTALDEEGNPEEQEYFRRAFQEQQQRSGSHFFSSRFLSARASESFAALCQVFEQQVGRKIIATVRFKSGKDFAAGLTMAHRAALRFHARESTQELFSHSDQFMYGSIRAAEKQKSAHQQSHQARGGRISSSDDCFPQDEMDRILAANPELSSLCSALYRFVPGAELPIVGVTRNTSNEALSSVELFDPFLDEVHISEARFKAAVALQREQHDEQYGTQQQQQQQSLNPSLPFADHDLSNTAAAVAANAARRRSSAPSVTGGGGGGGGAASARRRKIHVASGFSARFRSIPWVVACHLLDSLHFSFVLDEPRFSPSAKRQRQLLLQQQLLQPQFDDYPLSSAAPIVPRNRLTTRQRLLLDDQQVLWHIVTAREVAPPTVRDGESTLRQHPTVAFVLHYRTAVDTVLSLCLQQEDMRLTQSAMMEMAVKTEKKKKDLYGSAALGERLGEADSESDVDIDVEPRNHGLHRRSSALDDDEQESQSDTMEDEEDDEEEEIVKEKKDHAGGGESDNFPGRSRSGSRRRSGAARATTTRPVVGDVLLSAQERAARHAERHLLRPRRTPIGTAVADEFDKHVRERCLDDTSVRRSRRHKDLMVAHVSQKRRVEVQRMLREDTDIELNAALAGGALPSVLPADSPPLALLRILVLDLGRHNPDELLARIQRQLGPSHISRQLDELCCHPLVRASYVTDVQYERSITADLAAQSETFYVIIPFVLKGPAMFFSLSCVTPSAADVALWPLPVPSILTVDPDAARRFTTLNGRPLQSDTAHILAMMRQTASTDPNAAGSIGDRRSRHLFLVKDSNSSSGYVDSRDIQQQQQQQQAGRSLSGSTLLPNNEEVLLDEQRPFTRIAQARIGVHNACLPRPAASSQVDNAILEARNMLAQATRMAEEMMIAGDTGKNPNGGAAAAPAAAAAMHGRKKSSDEGVLITGTDRTASNDDDDDDEMEEEEDDASVTKSDEDDFKAAFKHADLEGTGALSKQHQVRRALERYLLHHTPLGKALSATFGLVDGGGQKQFPDGGFNEAAFVQGVSSCLLEQNQQQQLLLQRRARLKKRKNAK